LAKENIADFRRPKSQLMEESQVLEQKLNTARLEESENQNKLDQI